MPERVTVLFSGGTDSALSAVRMLEHFERVELFTIQPGYLLRFDRPAVMAEALIERYGSERVRRVVIDGRVATQKLLWDPMRRDLSKDGFGMASLVCLSCRLSMQTLAILYNLREGIPYIAEGSQRVQSDIPEQLESHVARNQERIFEEYGIVHLTPIYEETRSDRVLHEMGIVPKRELKKQFILYDTQATCPFGVPADVYARIFFKHALAERRERDTTDLARDRYPKMRAFIEEALASVDETLERATATIAEQIRADGYLDVARTRGFLKGTIDATRGLHAAGSDHAPQVAP